jgi:hypothetical protein
VEDDDDVESSHDKPVNDNIIYVHLPDLGDMLETWW